MKALFFIIAVSVIFFVGFWYVSLPDQMFSSAESGISFNYPARTDIMDSGGGMNDYVVSLRKTKSDGYLEKNPFITVSVISRISNVPLDKWLLMRGEKTWSANTTPPESIYVSGYDGIMYDWMDGTVTGKTAVFDAGDRVGMVIVYETTPEALKAFGTVLSNIKFAREK
jgi:hypothetical protein